MKKRVLSMLLCVCMVFGMCAAQVSANGNNVSEWAKAEVAEAVENNLIPPEMMGDDFSQNITRAEFAGVAIQLLKALWGDELNWHGGYISDVIGHPYEIYISGAYAYGITKGTGGDEATTGIIFSPDLHITREQLATMMLRVIKLCVYEDEWIASGSFDKPFDLSGAKTFADDSAISDFAKEAVYYMSKIGIIKGVDESNFAPQGTATKEQAISLALRIFNSRDEWMNPDAQTKTENSLTINNIIFDVIGKNYAQVKARLGKTHGNFWYNGLVYYFGEENYGFCFENENDENNAEPKDTSVCHASIGLLSDCIIGLDDDKAYTMAELSAELGIPVKYNGESVMDGTHCYSFEYKNQDVTIFTIEQDKIKSESEYFIKVTQ